MIQFKEKAVKQGENVNGLLDYPVLMAADILIYKLIKSGGRRSEATPRTHPDIAARFNYHFSRTQPVLKLPLIHLKVRE